MCKSYIKYNANMTRNVAYYMTTELCLVRATRKKNTCDLSYLESINSPLKEEEKSWVFKSRFWWVNQTLGSIRSGSKVGSVKSEKRTDYRVEPEQRQPATTSTFWGAFLKGSFYVSFRPPPPSALQPGKNFSWLCFSPTSNLQAAVVAFKKNFDQ